jgi:hypothetical protein
MNPTPSVKSTLEKSASTQRKNICAVVLAIALMAVVWYQMHTPHEGGGDLSEPPLLTSTSLPLSLGAPLHQPAPPVEAASRLPLLPAVDLENIIASNPFLLPTQPATIPGQSHASSPHATGTLGQHNAQSSELLSDVGNKSVAPPSMTISAIVSGSKGSAVLMGTETIRENDVVGDNWRVVAIDSKGLILEQRDDQPPASN